MKRISMVGVLLLAAALAVGWSAWGVAGEQHQVPVKEYIGQIKSVKIDKCGLQPGTCEGSITLALSGGKEVSLAILPGTWIQRGDHLVLIEELGVGNYVTARAEPLPAEVRRSGTVGSDIGERAITIEQATQP